MLCSVFLSILEMYLVFDLFVHLVFDSSTEDSIDNLIFEVTYVLPVQQLCLPILKMRLVSALFVHPVFDPPFICSLVRFVSLLIPWHSL